MNGFRVQVVIAHVGPGLRLGHAQVLKKYKVSEQSIYFWRRTFGAMEGS